MILYIGHSLFGMWGVLLGVPVSVFIYRYALMGLNHLGQKVGGNGSCEPKTPESI